MDRLDLQRRCRCLAARTAAPLPGGAGYHHYCLLFMPGVMVTSVPWQLGSATALEARRADEDRSHRATERSDVPSVGR